MGRCSELQTSIDFSCRDGLPDRDFEELWPTLLVYACTCWNHAYLVLHYLLFSGRDPDTFDSFLLHYMTFRWCLLDSCFDHATNHLFYLSHPLEIVSSFTQLTYDAPSLEHCTFDNTSLNLITLYGTETFAMNLVSLIAGSLMGWTATLLYYPLLFSDSLWYSLTT